MDYYLSLLPEDVEKDLSSLEREIAELDAKSLNAGEANRYVLNSGLSKFAPGFTQGLSVNHCADSRAISQFFEITRHLHIYDTAIRNNDLSEAFNEKVEKLLEWSHKILHRYEGYAKLRDRYLY